VVKAAKAAADAVKAGGGVEAARLVGCSARLLGWSAGLGVNTSVNANLLPIQKRNGSESFPHEGAFPKRGRASSTALSSRSRARARNQLKLPYPLRSSLHVRWPKER
jgi:hypothetical protein